jgi:hypothetical protein
VPLEFTISASNQVLQPTFTFPDPAHGSLDVVGVPDCNDYLGTWFCNQHLVYTPDVGFVGTDTWQYTAHDPLNGLDAVGTVKLSYVDDVTAPIGVLEANSANQEAGVGWTNVAGLRMRVEATDDYSGVSKVRLSNRSSNGALGRSMTFDYAPLVRWSLRTGTATTGTHTAPAPLPPGTYTIYAQWADGAGNWSAIKAASIKLDPIAPTLPSIELSASSNRFAPGVPVHLSYPASDTGGSGVALYHLQQSVNGAPYTDVAVDSGASWSDQMLAPSPSYRFRARARDMAGGWSAWAYTPTFHAAEVGESDAKIAYTGVWRCCPGSKFTIQSGATAKLTFTGFEVAWATHKGPNMGKANVYVDGTLVRTVDTYSPTLKVSAEVFRRTWATPGTHSILVKALATSGRPEVHIDWFLVLN